jgi:hypothetical protein
VTIPRLLTAVLLCGLGCLLAAGAAWRPAGPVASVAAAARPADADRVAPLAVLAAWDRERSAAWRQGDPAALRRLYVAGSRAGRADRTLLAAYAGRGLRVAGLRMQRAAVEVLAADAERVVLVVTDRVVGAVAIGRPGRVTLPRDGWSTRTVVLVRVGEEWRLAEVRDQERPLASTDVTSRSENS